VITSTWVLVIGLVLGLVLGLHGKPPPPQGGHHRRLTELRRNMLPYAKAELTLRKKALEHERKNPPPNENDLALSRLLRMPAPPLHR
jgi:hypothetical protein